VAAVAIRAEGLGKRYELGERESYGTLRDTLARAVRAPLRRTTGSPESRQFWALRDVSFELPHGEVLAVIGRNGAGKSTLLKVVSRITHPTTGRVEIHGRVGSLLEVGTGFSPELTGRENVFLNGAILGMRKVEIKRKFDEIVAFAEVDRFLDTPVKRYSSGMYVRLAFAVAAHLEPEILLVDEVLAVGDVAFQRKCLGKMQEVTKSGRTVLFVSHNMAAVQQLCRRSLLVSAGTVEAFGPTEDVVATYLSDAVTSADGEFDLSGHPARPPRLAPVIRHLTLRDDDGGTTARFGPQDAMVVDVLVDPPRPLRAPRMVLGISDSMGRRITSVANFFQREELGEIDGRRRVRIRIPALRLGTGRYLLSVLLHDHYDGEIDQLDDVAAFDVVWQNNFGTGESHYPHYGPTLTGSTWCQQEA
jgi:lipopolysaccharide transport system ATP-binding protein